LQIAFVGRGYKPRPAEVRQKKLLLSDGVTNWGDESVADALKKLIPFLFRPFCNRLIFKLKKIGETKTGSQLATLSATFSSAQLQTPSGRKSGRNKPRPAESHRFH